MAPTSDVPSAYGEHGVTMMGLLWTEFVIAAALVFARLYTNSRIVGEFGWDFFWAVLSLVSTIQGRARSNISRLILEHADRWHSVAMFPLRRGQLRYRKTCRCPQSRTNVTSDQVGLGSHVDYDHSHRTWQASCYLFHSPSSRRYTCQRHLVPLVPRSHQRKSQDL